MEYDKNICPVVNVDGVIERGKQYDLDITLPDVNEKIYQFYSKWLTISTLAVLYTFTNVFLNILTIIFSYHFKSLFIKFTIYFSMLFSPLNWRNAFLFFLYLNYITKLDKVKKNRSTKAFADSDI